MPRNGLSLLEIIISMVLLALSVAGLVNMFISGERLAIHARSRVTGGELGRFFLDPLQMDVRADTWDDAVNNSLSVGATPPVGPQDIGIVAYTPAYTVSAVGTTGVRRVRVNISWPEINPNE